LRDLVSGRRDRDGERRAAGVDGAKPSANEIQPIRHADRNAIAGAEAPVQQLRGDAGRLLV
jgi:hypothetical protein